MNCPRCKALVPVTGVGNEMSCAAGCGTWLPQPLVEALVGGEQLAYVCQHDHTATPLPPAACPVCKSPLASLIPEVTSGDPIVLDVCNDHGAWLERATRADFERAFAPAITRHSGIEQLVAALRAGDDASLRKVATRIVLLEERVREMAARRRG